MRVAPFDQAGASDLHRHHNAYGSVEWSPHPVQRFVDPETMPPVPGVISA